MCVLILCFFSLPHVLAKYELIYHLYAQMQSDSFHFCPYMGISREGGAGKKNGRVSSLIYGESRIVTEIVNHLL